MAGAPAAAGAGAAADGPPAVAGKKRGPTEKSDELRFKAFRVEYPWVDPERFADFTARQSVYCACCCVSLSIGSTSNAAKHAEGKKHKDKAAAAAVTAAAGKVQSTLAQATATSVESMGKKRRDARALMTAFFTRHAPPVQMPILWAADVVAGVHKLQAAGVSFGAAGTRTRDITAAHAAINKAIDACLAEGGPVILYIDSASLDMLSGTEKPLAILIGSRRFPSPVLLDIAMLEDSSAAATAAYVLALLAKRGVLIERVVCLMGDNVVFNDAVATIMNVLRAKCVPHIGGLITKDYTAVFSAFHAMTVHLHSFIRAGGSTARTAELEACGIFVHKLAGYPNRFCSTIAVAQYLVSKVEVEGKATVTAAQVIADWMAGSESIKAKDYDDKGTSKSVVAAFTGPDFARNVLQLAAVAESLGTLPAIVADASADEVEADLVPRLEKFAARMARHAGDGARLPVETAWSTLGARGFLCKSEAVKKELIDGATLVVRAGAAAAAAKFNKHMENDGSKLGALELLRRRQRFDPRVEPAEYKGTCQEDAIAFFYCDVEQATDQLVEEWAAYRRHWATLTMAAKSVRMAKFWDEMATDEFETLRELGAWWAQVASSAVAVERAFAFMRTMQDRDRYSMKEASFRAEMCFKVNGWLLDTLWRPAVVAAVGALPARSAASASKGVSVDLEESDGDD